MDKLEKYIRKNRNDFNIEPPSMVWEGIETSLDSKMTKPTRVINFYKYAVVGLLLLCSYLGFNLTQRNGVDEFEARLASIAPEYMEVKTFYNVKMTSGLRKIDDASLKNELLAQLSKLDLLLTDLKSSLEEAPTSKQKEIMHRILNIYKEKIKILDLVIAADKTRNQSLNKQL